MSFYGGLKDIASNLLQDKGQQVTFSRETVGSFDPKTGQQQISASTYTAYGVSFGYTAREIDGTLIQSSDIAFLMEAVSTTPKTNDQVTIDSIIYRIINIKPTNPAGTPVMYKVQLRR